MLKMEDPHAMQQLARDLMVLTSLHSHRVENSVRIKVMNGPNKIMQQQLRECDCAFPKPEGVMLVADKLRAEEKRQELLPVTEEVILCPCIALTVCQVDVYENQRRYFGSWKGTLLPTERVNWTNIRGHQINGHVKDRMPPRPGWKWVTDWEVKPLEANRADKDGWMYAVDFSKRPDEYKSKSSLFTHVRRRRWIRTQEKIRDNK